VAIKILRDSGEFREQAKRELEILKFINKVDHDKGFIVRTKDAFKHKKRNPCIVFERLEMNLYELMLQRK
jgi:dual specificity tyrosine-phosphorylation-regulated kinase 1